MPALFSEIVSFIAVANKIKDSFLRKMGVKLEIIHISTGDAESFYGFLQPLRYKNKLYLSHAPTELGFDTLQKYLLITSPDAPLEKIDGYNYNLFFNGNRFKLDHCERVYFGKEPYYFWSVVSKEA